MRSAKTTIVALAFSVLVGCGGSKPKDLIVGKWEMAGENEKKLLGMTYEFKPDGTMIVKMKNPIKEGEEKAMTGKYKFIDENTIEGEMEGISKKMKVEVTKDELTMTDPDGKKGPEKFKRVK